MRKALILFFLCIFLVNSGFSFDILNSDDESSLYFSSQSQTVKVEDSSNATFFTVHYNVSAVPTSVNFNLTSCSAGVCGQFNIDTLVQAANDQVSGLKPFIVSLGSNQTVNYDFDEPTFSLVSSSTDVANGEIDINFNTSDLSGISKIEVYEKPASSLEFFEEISNTTSYSYPVSAKGTYTLVFRVFDLAGLQADFEQSFNVSDVFKPTIVSTRLIHSDVYSLEIRAKDDQNLEELRISQSGVGVTVSLSGLDSTKVVGLPFDEGSITIEVEDEAGNIRTSNLVLGDSGIIIDYLSEHTNEKQLELISPSATSCVLEEFDSNIDVRTFSKSGDTFTISVDPDEESKEYDVKFYCENANFRVSHEEIFLYDIVEPTEPELFLEANEEGEIEIKWTTSFDEEGDVEYVLYRGSKEIYSGSKKTYTDDDVEYPDEHLYYLEVVDEAGNSARTGKEKITPLKVDIRLRTNLKDVEKVSENTFNLEIDAEEEADVVVTVKNSNKEIFSKTFEDLEDSEFDLDLTLENGINEVVVKVTDTFGNERERTFFIEYEGDEVLAAPETSIVRPEPVVQEPVIEAPEPEPVVEETPSEVPSKGLSGWLWLIFWVAVIILFLKFFVFDLKDREKRGKPSKSLFAVRRGKDSVLRHDLDRIKKNRIRRQEDRQREARRKEEEKEREKKLTRFEKQKQDDLASRPKDIFIPSTTREKSKKRSSRIIKEAGKKNLLNIPKLKKETSTFGFFKRKEKEQHNEEFGEYMSKVKSKESWDKTSQYYASTLEKEHKKQRELKEKIQKEEDAKIKAKEAEERKKHERIENERAKKEGLNEYLSKRTKKRKRFFFFAEKAVDDDIKRRH